MTGHPPRNCTKAWPQQSDFVAPAGSQTEGALSPLGAGGRAVARRTTPPPRNNALPSTGIHYAILFPQHCEVVVQSVAVNFEPRRPGRQSLSVERREGEGKEAWAIKQVLQRGRAVYASMEGGFGKPCD